MYFTHQEKQVLVFFVLAVVVGACALLLTKHHPAFERAFVEPFQQIVHKKININSATQRDWESLPSIGEYRAARIIEARQELGGFKCVEDVRYVKGIGPYVFNQIRPYLYDD